MDDKVLKSGFKKIVNNARCLFNEALLLKENNHLSRAYSLFQLSNEEVGKSMLIFKALLDFYRGTSINEKYFGSCFYSHIDKTILSLKAELIAIEIFGMFTKNKSDLRKKLLFEYENVQKFDLKKNQSLYVSIENDSFVSPESIITPKHVDIIEKNAKVRIIIADSLMQIIEEKINLNFAQKFFRKHNEFD